MIKAYLVTGSNEWAIKRGWVFPQFYDLETPGFWWFKSSSYYPCCWTKNKNWAEKWLRRLNA